MNNAPDTPHTPENEKTIRIRTLNDTFRTTFVGGHVTMTHGIQVLGTAAVQDIICAVRSYTDFTPDNDPYGEHDFGAFTYNGTKLFWKIDYYDPTLTYGSTDPSNPEQTRRVLTVMLVEEY